MFTPKSLLRHPRCVSSLDELASGAFARVIADGVHLSWAERVLFCSGKLYYELLEERERSGSAAVAIVRIEQYYPFHGQEISALTAQCGGDCRFYWVQEEPENMGAWHYLQRRFEEMSIPVSYVGRPADACPAVGSHRLHLQQQAEIIRRAFSD